MWDVVSGKRPGHAGPETPPREKERRTVRAMEEQQQAAPPPGPVVMACKLRDADRVRISIAARLAGQTPSAFLRRAAVTLAERELARHLRDDEGDGP